MIFVPLTLADLDIVIHELIGYGLWLYQRKWEREMEIDACTTCAQVKTITLL